MLVALTGASLLIVAPLLDLYREREARIEMRRTMLAHLRAAESQLPALRRRIAELRAGGRDENLMLDGGGDGIALANLQSEVEASAAAAGVAIGSTEGLPAEARGDYRRIGLHLVANGSYAALADLLARLGDAAPPLLVDNLKLHPLATEGGPGAPMRFEAGIDVYGFRAGSEPDAPKR